MVLALDASRWKKKKKKKRGERDKSSGAQQLTPEMVNGDLRKEQQSLSLSMDVQAMRERESHELWIKK